MTDTASTPSSSPPTSWPPPTVTPLDAPPPPDDPPTGEAMQTVTRLAARRRGFGLVWTVAGSLLTLVVSIAAYDYLLGLLDRYRPLGIAAIVLTALLALLLLAQLVREAWAFRRLARINAFRAEAAAAHATADRGAALALSRRLARFYAARPETEWGRRTLAEQRDAILDADAILELTERSPPRPPRRRRPPRDRGRLPHRRRRHRPVPLALIDVWPPSPRTSAWSAASPRPTAPTPASSAPGGCCAWSPPTCSPPVLSRSATT